MPKGRLEYLKRLLPFLQNQSEDCLYLNVFAPAHGKWKWNAFMGWNAWASEYMVFESVGMFDVSFVNVWIHASRCCFEVFFLFCLNFVKYWIETIVWNILRVLERFFFAPYRREADHVSSRLFGSEIIFVFNTFIRSRDIEIRNTDSNFLEIPVSVSRRQSKYFNKQPSERKYPTKYNISQYYLSASVLFTHNWMKPLLWINSIILPNFFSLQINSCEHF